MGWRAPDEHGFGAQLSPVDSQACRAERPLLPRHAPVLPPVCYLVAFFPLTFLSSDMSQDSCLENAMDGGAWWAAVHGVTKSLTWLSDFTFTFHFHALEKAMATHSSVLAWRIPGMGDPGGLPSMGLHRVGHDWSDLARVRKNHETSGEKEVQLGEKETMGVGWELSCGHIKAHSTKPLGSLNLLTATFWGVATEAASLT